MTSETTIDAEVLILRIITLMLVLGVVIFGLVVVFAMGALNPANPQPAGLDDELHGRRSPQSPSSCTWSSPASSPDRQLNEATANGRNLMPIASRRSSRLALLEGAAFINLVAVMAEHRWSLAIAGGLVFWMLARFPTRWMIENWLQPQQPPQQF